MTGRHGRRAGNLPHWHGAAPDHLMCHLAIQERDPATGQTTIWHEHVTDEDYRAVPERD